MIFQRVLYATPAWEASTGQIRPLRFSAEVAVSSSQAPSDEVNTPATPQKRSRFKKLIGIPVSLGRMVLLYCSFLGINHCLMTANIGEKPVASIQYIERRGPELITSLQSYPLEDVQKDISEADYWEKFQPHIQVFEAIAPDIATWLKGLHEQGKIVFHPNPGDFKAHHHAHNLGEENQVDNHEAHYEFISGKLHLFPEFNRRQLWQQVVGLGHEYRHSTQSVPKYLDSALNPFAYGRYAHPIEDEAYLYEKEIADALGRFSSPADTYLENRGLDHNGSAPPHSWYKEISARQMAEK